MKKTIQMFSLLVLVMCMYACSSGPDNANNSESTGTTIGVTDTEIVIGSFGPLTGPAALWGNIIKGMDAYFKMINEEGGINGRKIKFIMKDDAA